MKDHFDRELKTGDVVLVPCTIQEPNYSGNSANLTPIYRDKSNNYQSSFQVFPEQCIAAEMLFACKTPAGLVEPLKVEQVAQ